MSKQLSEKQVLKKLGIDNFRQLSKANVMQFASTLSDMDPEVAKKALEQFPDFAKTTKEVVTEQFETIKKALDSGDESMREVAKTYQMMLEALQKELDKETLTVEERREILDRMSEVIDKHAKKDSEHKAFLMKIARITGTCAVAAIAIVASVLGGNTNIQNAIDKTKDHNN